MLADAHISSLGDLCISLYVLLSQYRSCDNTLGDCFFQISFYSMSINYEKTRVKFPWDLYWENKTYELKRSIAITSVPSAVYSS